jgi:transposase
MSTKNTQSYPPSSEYSESFKMTVVAEVLSGQITQTGAEKKYGIGGHCTISRWIRKYGSNKELKTIAKVRMPNDKTKIKELKTRVYQLEHLVSDLQLERRALEKLIELAEREYKISIKKNFAPKRSMRSEESLEK